MVESIDVLIESYELQIEHIHTARKKIAELKKEKIECRSKAWLEASGTAKEKEDFVRAAVASYDYNISVEESLIEKCYSTIDLIKTKLVYCDEEDVSVSSK